jgi:hypothetical protein
MVVEPAIGFLAIRGTSKLNCWEGRATTLSWEDWYNRGEVSSGAVELGGKLAKFLDTWAQLRYVDKFSVSLS